ncbi:MAG: Flp pilus assembly complex ATPase component TadA [Clostridia bacterium]|nr:Flp pilus assembly complex ATPase component TadA [Clostridia bacterium]
MKSCLRRLLREEVYWLLEGINNLCEIRFRRGKNLVVYTFGDRKVIDYVCTKEDIDYTLKVATSRSLYAVEESIKQGYISCEGGIRIGIVGEANLDNGKLRSIKNINSLVIRIAHSINTLPLEVLPIIDKFDNTLIISPPYLGKTTMLREMTRRLSDNGNDILVIDERNELSATMDGEANLDLGSNTDVMVGVPKINCYEGAVRTMSPDIIVTDEIFGSVEVDCLIDAVRSGVKVMATAHGNNIDKFLSSKGYTPLVGVISNYLLLGDNLGQVKEVRYNCSV